MKTATQVLEQQIKDRLAKEIANDIDREILWYMMIGFGWTLVMISRLTDNNHAIDITYWLEDNCKQSYERRGRDFIFEDPKDATTFILRWI